MSHNFHKTIRRMLDIDLVPGRFVWDQACGGSSQWISLFREGTKSRGARYACVDAVVVVDPSVRLILEIEESGANGFLPNRILGKVTTSGLCRFFIAAGEAHAVPFGEPVTFLQIVNTAGLKSRSRKVEQYRNLERDIRDRLLPIGSIGAYFLIPGDADAFQTGTAGDDLRRIIRSAVGTSRPLSGPGCRTQ